MIWTVAIPPKKRPRDRALLLAAVCASILFCGGADAFDGKLSVGAGGGYTGMFSRYADSLSMLNGGGAAGRIEVGFDQTWGLALTGGMTWFQSYNRLVAVEAENDEGESVTTNELGPAHTGVHLKELAVTIIYVIDVWRISPYLGAGAASVMTTETIEGGDVNDVDVSLRFDLGADLRLTDHFQLGALITFDTYLTDRSSFSSRTGFWLVAGFYWDFHKTGRQRPAALE